MNQSMTVTILLAVIFALPATVCSEPKQMTQTAKLVVKGFNDLAFKMLHYQGTGNEENTVVSGVSAAYALAMLELGAGNTTRQEIQQALGHPNVSLQDLQQIYKCMTTNINKVAGNTTLRLANALFCEDAFWIKEQWEKNVTDLFSADLAFVDFAKNPSQVVQQMNAWVANKTCNHITSLFDATFDSSTVVVLINAIAFKSRWMHEFDGSYTAPFYGTRHTQQVQMISRTGVLKAGLDPVLGLYAVEIPFVDNVLSMVLLVPKESSANLSAIEQQLNACQLNRILNLTCSRNVSVSFPKFTFSQNYTLNNLLKKLGVNLAFRRGADFGGVNEDTTTAFVSKVLQAVRVDINGRCARTVAASGLGIDDIPRQEIVNTAHSNVMSVQGDRPFLFLIRCPFSGMIFVAGRVTDPTHFL